MHVGGQKGVRLISYGDVRKWDAECLHEIVDRLNQRCIGLVADTVAGLRHGITEAETLAGKYYLRIEDNGALTDTAGCGFPSEAARQAW